MSRVGKLNIGGVEPQYSRPDQTNLLSGNPCFKLWEDSSVDDNLNAGVWESSPGKWRFSITHWEYFHMLSGVSIVSEFGGESHILKAGDNLILRPGFEGTWEVIETTRKAFIVR